MFTGPREIRWRESLPDVWPQGNFATSFADLSRLLELSRTHPEIVALKEQVDELAKTVQHHEQLLESFIGTEAVNNSPADLWLRSRPELHDELRNKHVALIQKGRDFEIVSVADSINAIYTDLEAKSIDGQVELIFIPAPSV